MWTKLCLWFTVIVYPFLFYFKPVCKEMWKDSMGINQSFPKGNHVSIQPSPLASHPGSLAEGSSPRALCGRCSSYTRDICPAILSRFRLTCGDRTILTQIKMCTHLWCLGNCSMSISHIIRVSQTKIYFADFAWKDLSSQ